MSQPATARATADFYEFGHFRIEPSTRSLYRAGQHVALTPKLFETLLLLVEEAGRVVAKEQLMERVWPGVVVEEGSIANNISALRKILNPGFEDEGPIATLARHGYRFTAEVRAGRSPVTEKDTIVLADFQNKTGDPVFDDTLKQALRLDLEQSPFLNILSERKVTATLRMMSRSADEPVTGEVARELGQRADCKAFLAGSIFGVGDEYVIGLNAIHCDTGDTLVAEQARAHGKGGVLKALDQAASAMRSRLGESLASVQRFSVPLEEVTTPSLEALKAYSVGRKLAATAGDGAGLPHHLRAVELDPDFALAYGSLAVAYDNLGQATRAIECGKRAYDQRERGSERERHRITAYYLTAGIGNIEKGIQAYDLLKRNYPRDAVSYLNAGSEFMRSGQWERALAETEESAALDPGSSVMVGNLALILMALGRGDDARLVLEQGLGRKLDAYYIRLDLYCEAFLRGDRPAMQRQLDWMAERSGEEEYLLCAEADVEAHSGRLQKARQLSRRAIDSARRADSPETAALWQGAAALREAEFGNPAQAREGATASLALSSGRDVRSLAALAFARAGDVAKAHPIAESLEKDYPQNTLVQRYWLPTIRAAIEIDAKNPDKAVEILQVAAPLELGLCFPFEIGMMYPAYVRGEAHLRLGQGKQAAAEFQKFLDHPGIVKYFPLASLARLGLARALALDGKAADSRLAYERFFALWSDADPEIPVLAQAKAEYAA